jgi:hypothetical protein
MAHRFNFEHNRKTPKPTARERTWHRWRVRKEIGNQDDELRIERKISALERIEELLGMKSK